MMSNDMDAGVRFPAQVHMAMKALGSDTRIAILLDLADNGEKTFSQLRGRHSLDPSSLTNHLKALAEGSLIRNFYKKIPDDQQYSFYDATNFGKDFLTTLADVVEQYFAPTAKEDAATVNKGQFPDQEELFWKELVRHRMDRLRELEFLGGTWGKDFTTSSGSTLTPERKKRREILEV